MAVHPSQPVVFTGDMLGRIDQWFLLDTCLDRSASSTSNTPNTSNTSTTLGRETGRRARLVELTSPVGAARGADA